MGSADKNSGTAVLLYAGKKSVNILMGLGRGLSLNRISSWGGGCKTDCECFLRGCQGQLHIPSPKQTCKQFLVTEFRPLYSASLPPSIIQLVKSGAQLAAETSDSSIPLEPTNTHSPAYLPSTGSGGCSPTQPPANHQSPQPGSMLTSINITISIISGHKGPTSQLGAVIALPSCVWGSWALGSASCH